MIKDVYVDAKRRPEDFERLAMPARTRAPCSPRAAGLPLPR